MQQIRMLPPWRASLAVGVLLATSSLAAPLAAAADGYVPQEGEGTNPITDRFYLRATFWRASVRTQLRIDPTGNPYGGTSLSGENDLGLPERDNQGRVELMFRLRERNRFRVDYLLEDRSGQVTLPRTVVFGDQTFPPGTTVQSTLNWRMMGFTYTHAFLQTEHFELGAGLGVHLIDADAIAQTPDLLQRHETSVAGAWPTLAVDGIWNISRRFALTARGQYLGTDVNKFSGSLADYHGDVQYRWKRNFAVGLGYSYIRASYESQSNGTPGRLVLALSGPEMFVRISF